MSEFKVGDRVKLNKSLGGWYPSNEGKTGTITCITHEWTYVTFDNSKGDTFENDFGNPELLKPISRPSESPPATITHEGYTYNRGERVRPEWVKDGAWVVNICSGELRKVKEVKPGVFDLVVNEFASVRYQDAIRDQYRPFTATDWKWGMWAEYKGEKVFVCKRIDTGVIASNPTNSYFLISFSEATPTTAP